MEDFYTLRTDKGRAALIYIAAGAITALGACGSTGQVKEGESASGISSGDSSAASSSASGTAGLDTDNGSGGGSDTNNATGSTSGPTSGSVGTTEDTTDGSGSTGVPLDPELLYLVVTPAETVLEVDLNTPATQDFLVIGNYDNGDAIDVTAEATWAVSNPGVGAMNGATLQIPGFADNFFESTIVTATVEGFEGQAQLTVAAYRLTGDQQDFFFLLPFEDPAGNQDKALTFSTDIKSMDVFVSMDTTGSMAGEINNLQNSLATTIIPEIQMAIPDTQFGAGTFDDFPVSPHGSPGDQPFSLLAPISNNVADVQAAVLSMSSAGGNDFPEAHAEALFQIATGAGIVGPGATNVPAYMGAGLGGVGFREGSLPIVVSITDATAHNGSNLACPATYTDPGVLAAAHTEAEAITALSALCARVVQIATAGVGGCDALGDAERFAEATGAVIPPEAWDVGGRPPGCNVGQCCTGTNGAGVALNGDGMCPMAYLASGNGSGVDSSLSDAIQLLAAYGQFDVTSETDGVAQDTQAVALPAGFTTADFIKAVTPLSHGPVPLPGVPDPTITPEAFLNVIPDTDVVFTVEAFNDFVPHGPQPRLFVATIRVLADNCGDLDEREVFILVPPEALPDPG